MLRASGRGATDSYSADLTKAALTFLARSK
jgi:hypothetical protein